MVKQAAAAANQPKFGLFCKTYFFNSVRFSEMTFPPPAVRHAGFTSHGELHHGARQYIILA